MPAKSSAQPGPLMLVFGEDDYAVQQRGREIFRAWQEELGGMDHETIDARVGNSGEALGALKKLHEALNTLPFFGGGKAIWFKDCSFLGDDRSFCGQGRTRRQRASPIRSRVLAGATSGS